MGLVCPHDCTVSQWWKSCGDAEIVRKTQTEKKKNSEFEERGMRVSERTKRSQDEMKPQHLDQQFARVVAFRMEQAILNRMRMNRLPGFDKKTIARLPRP
jgi:hypothetical protein